QAFFERFNAIERTLPRLDREVPHPVDPPCRLLRTRGQRPKQRRRRRCAADKPNELAPLHSITSSARVSSAGGTMMPSAFAVFKLITSSNLVGCSTGRSAGLASLKILSTKVADRR